ncbi:MAG: transcription elongation GreA/GreB family factor [Myxococcota bacterium]
MKPDKPQLLSQLLDHVRSDLASLIRTQEDASKGATHSENRAEHAKDTRATEQSYLARGLAQRVEELRLSKVRLETMALNDFGEDIPIALSAIVEIEVEPSGDIQHWWLVPAGGGHEVQLDAQTIKTVTPSSPLGRALLGLQCGDDGTLKTPRGQRSFQVRSVA